MDNPFDQFDEAESESAANPFDQFDEAPNPFDQFDEKPESESEEDTTLEAIGQNVLEVGKGIPEGAVHMGGTALKGVAASVTEAERNKFEFADVIRNAASMPREELNAKRKEAMGKFSTGEAVEFNAAVSDVLAGNDPEKAAARAFPDTIGEKIPSIKDSSVYKAGEDVSKFAKTILPAAPGYEDSIGRGLGGGLGSVVAGIGLSAIPGAGPVIAGSTFMMAGAGEAVENAVREGATEEQIIAAARGGTGAGATDSVPIETFMGRIPLPGGKFIKLAADQLGPAVKAVGRIGWQALVEGVQEGGQKWLQNLITQQVYKPEQSLTEGVLPEAGMGAGVGAIVETLATPMRRRGTRETARNNVQLTQADHDSALEDGDILEGLQTIAETAVTPQANDILARNNLPPLDTPVNVEINGVVKTGKIVDQFTSEANEIGLSEDGVRIEFEDGTSLDKFMGDDSVQITPVTAQDTTTEAVQAFDEQSASNIESVVEEVHPIDEFDDINVPLDDDSFGVDGEFVPESDVASPIVESDVQQPPAPVEDDFDNAFDSALEEEFQVEEQGMSEAENINEPDEWVDNDPNAPLDDDAQGTDDEFVPLDDDSLGTDEPAPVDGERSFDTYEEAQESGAVGDRAKVSIKLNSPIEIDGEVVDTVDGSIIELSESFTKFPFVQIKPDGKNSVQVDKSKIAGITVTRTQTESDEDLYERQRGERIVKTPPVNREEMKTSLYGLAMAEHAEEDSVRKMQIRQQFDDLADTIELAKDKRKYLRRHALSVKDGEFGIDDDLPGVGDLVGSLPTDVMGYRRYKPSDLELDPEARKAARNEDKEPKDHVEQRTFYGNKIRKVENDLKNGNITEKNKASRIANLDSVDEWLQENKTLTKLKGRLDNVRKAVNRIGGPTPAGIVSKVFAEKFSEGTKFKTIVEARKVANKALKESGHAITDKEIEEAIELGIVIRARKIVADSNSPYTALEMLYNSQPILGTRTSTSIEQQAYSTPAPLAFLASQGAGIDQNTTVYEPTAGNGMLLIEAAPSNITANELNDGRVANLKSVLGDGATITQSDATETAPAKQVDVVIANPPFGKVRGENKNKVYPLGESTTTEIDHAISLKALESMKDDGRAVLIIGSQHGRNVDSTPKEAAMKYRSDNARRFFKKLYDGYNVKDHYTVDGKLYNRQGAQWPVDVIVIEGRGKSSRDLPMKTAPEVFKTWTALGVKLDASNSVDATEQSDGNGNDSSSGQTNEATDDGGVHTNPVVADRPDDSAGDTGSSEGTSASDGRPGESTDGQQPSSGGRNPSGEQRPADVDGETGDVSDTSGSDQKRPTEPSNDEAGDVGGVSGDPVSVKDDFDSAFDDALNEQFGEKPKSSPRTPAQAATSAATNTVKGLDEATDALAKLFGADPTRLNSGLSFDKKTYEAAKPHFISAVAHFKEVGTDVTDMVKALVKHLVTVAKMPREAIERMKPYVKQFIEDVKSGALSLTEETTTEEESEATGEPIPFPKIVKLDESITTEKQIREVTREASDFVQELKGRPDLFKQLSGYVEYDADGAYNETIKNDSSRFVKPYVDKYETNSSVTTTKFKNAKWEAHLPGDAALPGIRGYVLAEAHAWNDIIKEYRKVIKAQKAKSKEAAKEVKKVDRVNKEVETEHQVQYAPTSQARFAVGTLVPKNMQTAMTKALTALSGRVGSIDQYVADKLDYTLNEMLGTEKAPGYFSAEQVDALALAIDNVENDGGFIIGDQTGVGKGRFVAGMLKYAISQGKTPIFATKSPGLYADMVRDMRDIGMDDISDRILVTNDNLLNKKAIPLDNDNAEDVLSSLKGKKYKTAIAEMEKTGALPEGIDILFTNYSQMRYKNGRDNPRMRAIKKLAPNAVVVLDESHLAGGTDAPAQIDKETGEPKLTGADFVREVLGEVHGVVYSSATYAKNPAVMSLYFKTDLSLGVDDIKDLAETIRAGGVPLQQVVANMLVESGQYARRERSFDRVSIEQTPLPTDKEAAETASEALRNIFTLDKDYLTDVREGYIEELAQQGDAGAMDNAIGEQGISQTGFSSIMHNVINQMLLSLKAKAAVDMAIELHKKGEKPIIALANTNEQIMKDFIDDNGISFGDEIDVPFNAILERYVHRLRRVTKKDENKKKTHITLTDEDILKHGGGEALAELKRVEKFVKEANLTHLPGSPIDYITGRLEKAGIRTGEITGRGMVITDGVLTQRVGSEAEKKRTMNGYNSGELDALIINESGSTGYSMHATDKPGNDGKQRHLIVLQPDANIDVFMQILGRIHRTGQIKLPNYTIGVSDLSVEKRLAAVLMRKMASLNANTTASKDSAVSLKETTDFLNKYGDEIVQEYLTENPDIADLTDMEGKATDGIAGKFTGRLAIVEPAVVDRVYEEIEENYKAHIEALDRMGMNTLEAKTLDLDANTVDSLELVPEQDGGDSPFTAASVAETVSVKKLGKPFTEEELKAEGLKVLDGKSPSDFVESQIEEVEKKGPAYMASLEEKAVAAYKTFEVLKKELDAKAIEEAAAEGEEFDVKNRPQSAKETKAFGTYVLWNNNGNKAKDKMNDIYGKMRDYAPGKAVRITVSDGENSQFLYGVSLGVNIKGVSVSPTAASSYKVRFAIADSGREITIPLSKITGDEASYSTEAIDQRTALKFFKEGYQESRETRQMITGNLLRGYSQFRKGQIVMFTRDDGSVAQGILMPKDFNVQEELDKQPVEFETAQQIIDFLRGDMQGQRRVHSKDDIMGFTYSQYNGLQLVVKRKGGKQYYLNKQVRDVLGDLAGKKNMSARIQSDADFKKVFDIYKENLGTVFISKTHKDEAREITGKDVKSSRSRTSSDFKKKLPRTIQALKARLKQLGLSDKIALRLEEKLSNEDDGQYHAYQKLIEVALTSGDTLATLNHEIIHALKDLGVIRPLEWKTLEKAALADKELMSGIEERYPDLSREDQIEEAVADMFGSKSEFGGPLKRAVERVKKFIRALKRSLNRQGFKTADDIFDAIESGEIGSRDGELSLTPAIRDQATKDIFTGANHGEAYNDAIENLVDDSNDPTEGFVNQYGKFLSRDEAEALAGIRTTEDLIDLIEAPVKSSRPKPLKSNVPFADPAVEKRMQESNGVDQPTLVERIKNRLDGIKAGFTQHYRNLPTTAAFAEVKEWLRAMEAAPEASKSKVIRILKGITNGMTQQDLEIFTRKLILDDLAFEADNNRIMAFGLKDKDAVLAELAIVDPVIAERPDLQAKLRQRTLVSRHVAKQLVDEGVLTEDQIANPNYFRHQILEYADAHDKMVAQGTGSTVKTPFWGNRKGSIKDFNTNYLEAEFDWLHKAFVDVATARLIGKIKKSVHNIRTHVLARAKAHNSNLMAQRIEKDIADNGYDLTKADGTVERTSPMNEQWKTYKKMLAMGFSHIEQQISEGNLEVPERFADIARSMTNDDAETGSNIFPFLTWLAESGRAGSMGASLIFKTVHERKAFVKDTLDHEYANPLNIDSLIARGFAPEGFVSWQPEKGKILFTASTLTDKSIDKIVSNIGEMESGVELSDKIGSEIREELRDQLVVGGDKYKMIIPAELAATLDQIKDNDVIDALEHTNGKLLRKWKIWRLLNPRGYTKYNINNFSGDMDAVMAGNPHAISRMKQAMGELKDVVYNGGIPSERMQEAIDRGVIGSGQTLQEIPDIHQLEEFEKLLKEDTLNPGKLSLRALKGMWRGMKRFNNFREDWLRYATYLDYADRIAAGESMDSIGYGATLPPIVDAINDPIDKAAHLSRELVGDYGNISVIGQRIRTQYIPFYSWMEINTKRYVRLTSNAFGQGIGEGLKVGGGMAAAAGARKSAWLGARMLIGYTLIQAWNNILFDDEEEELDEEQRAKLHINFGRAFGTDEIVTLKIQGALSDFLGWFGFAEAMSQFNKIEDGKATWGDVGKAVAKGAPNRIVSGLHPVKTLAEASFGLSTYPDVFEPRKIRDGWRHLANTFAVEHEYDLLANKPSRGYFQSWKNAVVYSRDPGESAYNGARSAAFNWNKDRLGVVDGGYSTTDRSNAVYDIKRAIKFGDKSAEKSARKVLKDIVLRDNKSRNRKYTTPTAVLNSALKRMHPLSGIPKNRRYKYKKSLPPKERQQLDAAIKWYNETFK